MDYTSVRVTEGLSEVIESADDVAASDVRDWKASGDRSTIPFSLLHNLHKHMTLEAKPSGEPTFSWYTVRPACLCLYLCS